MANRFTAPASGAATQRTILRARRAVPGATARGLVVAASLAVTLLGWAVFAQHEAQDTTLPATDAAQVVAPAQPVTTAGFVLPDLASLWATVTGGQTGQATGTDTTTTTRASGTSSTIRTAFATTQSSR